MKNMILTFLVVLVGCNESEPSLEQENSIYGTWGLKEQRIGNVGDIGTWQEVSESYKINFEDNLSYSSTGNPICPSNPNNIGTFLLQDEDNRKFVDIKIRCDESDSSFFTVRYYYSVSYNSLILSPDFACDEGCEYKFIKVSKLQFGD